VSQALAVTECQRSCIFAWSHSTIGALIKLSTLYDLVYSGVVARHLYIASIVLTRCFLVWLYHVCMHVWCVVTTTGQRARHMCSQRDCCAVAKLAMLVLLLLLIREHCHRWYIKQSLPLCTTVTAIDTVTNSYCYWCHYSASIKLPLLLAVVRMKLQLLPPVPLHTATLTVHTPWCNACHNS
jgi:hypothetical protein